MRGRSGQGRLPSITDRVTARNDPASQLADITVRMSAAPILIESAVVSPAILGAEVSTGISIFNGNSPKQVATNALVGLAFHAKGLLVAGSRIAQTVNGALSGLFSNGISNAVAGNTTQSASQVVGATAIGAIDGFTGGPSSAAFDAAFNGISSESSSETTEKTICTGSQIARDSC